MITGFLGIGAVAGAARNGSGDTDHRLGRMLVAADLLTEEQLTEALKHQAQSEGKVRLGNVLQDMGFVTQDELRTIASDQADSMGIPPLPDSAASYAIRVGHVVYVIDGQQGSIALLSWQQQVRNRVGDLLEISACPLEEWQRIKREAAGERKNDLGKHKAVRRATALFDDATSRNASDIHLTLEKRENGEGGIIVQYRINGSLIRMPDMPLAHGEPMFRVLLQSMASGGDNDVNENVDQHAVISDPALLSGHSRQAVQIALSGIRLARSPIMHGQCMALRLLYNHKSEARGTGRLTVLGYSARHLHTYAHLARLTSGINLFTGPTGSGKSTTLFAQVNAIVDTREGIRVITMEDPVENEFKHPNIWQYKFNAKSDEEKARVFAGKLKTALREDPDLIMVVEIRGLEVAQEAINASITGHPVWSTLHVTDPFAVIPRLVGMGVDRFMLADPSMLSSITAQRLVKTVCPYCEPVMMKNPRDILPEREARALEEWAPLTPFGDLAKVRLQSSGRVDGTECPHCRGTGEGPRTVVAQVLPTDEDLLRDALEEGAAVARRKYMARDDCETGMMAHGILKVLSGRVDPRRLVDALGPLIPPARSHRKLTEDDL